MVPADRGPTISNSAGIVEPFRSSACDTVRGPNQVNTCSSLDPCQEKVQCSRPHGIDTVHSALSSEAREAVERAQITKGLHTRNHPGTGEFTTLSRGGNSATAIPKRSGWGTAHGSAPRSDRNVMLALYSIVTCRRSLDLLKSLQGLKRRPAGRRLHETCLFHGTAYHNNTVSEQALLAILNCTRARCFLT